MRKVVALRERRGWTQQALATAAGVSLRTVQRLERDELEPSKETLLAVAGALDVGMEEVFASEWETIERDREELLRRLTRVFDDLDECVAAMVEHRGRNEKIWLEPAIGAKYNQLGWRDTKTGVAFVVTGECLLALPEERRRRFLDERRWIARRIEWGDDPWEEGDPWDKHGDEVLRIAGEVLGVPETAS